MQHLYYQFPGTWFGDCMPFGKGDTFYLFHQRDTRRPVPFGEPFGWDLAVTRDFVHYEDRGVAIPGARTKSRTSSSSRAASLRPRACTTASTQATTGTTPPRASPPRC